MEHTSTIFVSDWGSYAIVYSEQQYFHPGAFNCTNIILVCTNSGQHRCSRFCTCATFLDYVLHHCKNYHTKALSRQKLKINVLPWKDSHMVMHTACNYIFGLIAIERRSPMQLCTSNVKHWYGRGCLRTTSFSNVFNLFGYYHMKVNQV